MTSYEYTESMNEIVNEIDRTGDIPNIYSDNYKKVIMETLIKEKECCKKSKSYGYLQFSCLVDMFRENGEIFDMVVDYMSQDEEDEKRNKIAIKIADGLVKSASLYYRDDIEYKAEILYRRRLHGVPN